MRKFYQQGSDEPHVDLTPSTEKAITWLGTLTARSFVGTESRLLTLFELLRKISSGIAPSRNYRISYGAFWLTRLGCKTAASWISCAASNRGHWHCARRSRLA
ncbi:hypothetical protein GCM10022212_22440 [Actimicrobium antarcticum]|uniref:Uncharacterized protein n=1 Tax=Actimicrobium antarcticum TaxID=1051899 RepID=A0ABP7TCM6_9BURK